MQTRVGVMESAARELSDRAYKIQTVLEGFAVNSDRCWPSLATLTKIVGRDIRSIRRILAELELAGWIRREGADEGFAYIVLLKRIFSWSNPSTSADLSTERSDKNVRGGRTNLSPELIHKELSEAQPSGAGGEKTEDVGVGRSRAQTKRERARWEKARLCVNKMAGDAERADRHDDAIDHAEAFPATPMRRSVPVA